MRNFDRRESWKLWCLPRRRGCFCGYCGTPGGAAPLFPQPRETYRQSVYATLAVVAWLAMSAYGKLFAERKSPEDTTLPLIQASCVIQLAIAAFLATLLSEAGRKSLRDCGVFGVRIDRQILLGVLAFLAAIWPTGMMLIVSQWWRTVETQHPLLQVLEQNSNGEVIAWIAVSAVIAAPLAEELLFRVTLQGWLSERLSGSVAIVLTAAVFALVHGWRDALPLVPLWRALGYVFQHTRSYWACATTHAPFNGMFLCCAMKAGSSGVVKRGPLCGPFFRVERNWSAQRTLLAVLLKTFSRHDALPPLRSRCISVNMASLRWIRSCVGSKTKITGRLRSRL